MPIECPLGYYCRAGLSNPIECNSLMTCSGEGNTFGRRSWFIVVMIFVLAATVFAIYLSLRWLAMTRMEKSTMASEKHRKTSSSCIKLAEEFTRRTAALGGQMQGFTRSMKYTEASSIEFKDLSMTIKGSKLQVLDSVSGHFPSGSMVALMGPSGSGKTSFMNALASRGSYGITTGSVVLNGAQGINIGTYPRLTGFVPQDDIMHDGLSVYDNLSFSAHLRLPSTMTDEQKYNIIEDTLQLIGLDSVRNSVVGSPEKRGISGGQKKRLNIGIELVAYPRILFLDEPTRCVWSYGLKTFYLKIKIQFIRPFVFVCCCLL